MIQNWEMELKKDYLFCRNRYTMINLKGVSLNFYWKIQSILIIFGLTQMNHFLLEKLNISVTVNDAYRMQLKYSSTPAMIWIRRISTMKQQF